jgi:hypothetical protein
MTQQSVQLTEEEYFNFTTLDNNWKEIVHQMGLLKIEELNLQQTEYNLEIKKNDLINQQQNLLEAITIKHGQGTVNLEEKCFILYSED